MIMTEENENEINENDQHSSGDEEENTQDEVMDSGEEEATVGVDENESSDGYIESESEDEGVADINEGVQGGGDEPEIGGDVSDVLSEDDTTNEVELSKVNVDESALSGVGGKDEPVIGVEVGEAHISDETLKEEKKPKRFAPQKQKPLIHTLLKRAKIYEIRKLTRRSNVLKSAKGTEEQKNKKQRKAERLRKEVEAIREFMMDEITERTVNAFKGKSDIALYNDMWRACADPFKIDEMIQLLSNKAEENFADIAYFRMLSSKDLVDKFRRIARGENLKKPNQMKKSKGKKNSTKTFRTTDDDDDKIRTKKQGVVSNMNSDNNQKEITAETDVNIMENANAEDLKEISVKRKRKLDEDVGKDSVENEAAEKVDLNKENEGVEKKKIKKSDIKKSDRVNKADTSATKTDKANKKTPHKETEIEKSDSVNSDKPQKTEPKKKKVLRKDDFFMDHAVEVTDDEDSTAAETDGDEEEFTAPVAHRTENPDIQKKKNRMGQRDRKRFQDIKHGRQDPRQTDSFRGGRDGERGGRGRGRGESRGGRGRGESRGGRGHGESRGDRGRDFTGNDRRDFGGSNRGARGSFQQKSASQKKDVDATLHPSWQAKQRQKNQQIVIGTGTKITFDD